MYNIYKIYCLISNAYIYLTYLSILLLDIQDIVYIYERDKNLKHLILIKVEQKYNIHRNIK